MTPLWIPQDVAEAFLLPRIQSSGVGDMLPMGVIDQNNSLVAVAAIHDWNPEYGTCEISCAADTPKWLCRGPLLFFFGHIFDVMKLQMCYITTSSDNPRPRRIFQLLGATESVIPRGRGRNVDAHIQALTDDQWLQFKQTRLTR